jgi:uncharacterized membrane protein
MNKCNTILRSAVAGALSLGLVSAQAIAAEKPKAEKCYGVAKSGKNDCQTSTNACAGHVKEERRADAWIFLPAGTCERISGGSLAPKKS